MHAHSTTIPARPGCIEDGVALVNDELLPIMAAVGGRGVSLLVDPASGRCIVTSSWDSEAAMRASYEHLQPIRQRLLKALGANSFEVQEWEIAFFHRAQESPAGSWARVAWSRPPGGEVDVGATAIKTEVLPHLKQQDGFCSASMFADREHGMLCGTVSFDSAATVEGNREFGAQARAKMTERSGIEWVEVMEFELAVHHLRVPELI